MAMKVSQILPHVWVMDEAVHESLLDHVDKAFATDGRSTTTKDLVVEFVTFTLSGIYAALRLCRCFDLCFGRQRGGVSW